MRELLMASMHLYYMEYLSLFIKLSQPFLGLLVQLEKLPQLMPSHLIRLHLFLLILVRKLLIAQFPPPPFVHLEQFLSISHVVLLLFLFFRFLLFWGWRLWQLDVIFDDFIGEYYALVWSADPRGFGFYFDWGHREFLEDFLLETRDYVWLFDVG